MATYVYECPEHGQVDVVKSMADSGRVELCIEFIDVPNEDTGYDPMCGLVMRKVITPPAALFTNGTSGDGYLFNRKSGLRSSGRGNR